VRRLQEPGELVRGDEGHTLSSAAPDQNDIAIFGHPVQQTCEVPITPKAR
jgi:hypothetical protein